MAQAAALYTDLVLNDAMFVVPLRRAVAETERGSRNINNSLQRIDRAAAQSQQRMRLLGYQISDVGTQLAGGQNPFLILAQQAPHVANALDGVGGAAGRVAAFLSGPWGAALLAAGSIAGVLASKLWEATEASKKKEQAADALKEALDRLNSSAAENNHKTEIGIQADINAARAMGLRQIEIRKTTLAMLEQAKVQAGATADRAVGPGEAAERAGARLLSQGRNIEELNRKIAEATLKLDQAAKGVRLGEIQLSLRKVAGETDKATAATQRYENELDQLERLRGKSKITQDQFERGARSAKQRLDAETQSLRDNEKAIRSRDSGASRNADRARREIEKAAAERERFEQTLVEARQGNLVDTTDRLRATPLTSYGSDILKKDLEEAGRTVEAFTSRGGAYIEEMWRRADDAAFEFNRDLSRGLADAVIYGDNLGDVLENSFKRAAATLIETGIMDILTGKAPSGLFGTIASGVGSIFGGGRANGGGVQRGKLYEVGERGRELFAPGMSGTIIPNHALRAMNDNGGGGRGVIVSVDARGAGDPAAVEAAAMRAVMSAAPTLLAAAQGRTTSALTRPSLPRGLG